jgi:1-acyl-sn-glycerol-3-phosphate acyltransferase
VAATQENRAQCREAIDGFSSVASRAIAVFGDGLSETVRRGLAIRYAATGFDASKFADGPVVIIANHVSLLDTLAIRYSLPRSVRARTATVGARDFFVPGPKDRGVKRLLRSWSCAYVVHAYRVCLIGRGDDMGDGIPTINSVLRSGWNLILFPEGTRSRTGHMGRFRMGFAHLAESTGVAVLPVGIRGTDGVMAVGSPLLRHGSVVLRAGEPTRIHAGESHADFLQRMRMTIAALSAS